MGRALGPLGAARCAHRVRGRRVRWGLRRRARALPGLRRPGGAAGLSRRRRRLRARDGQGRTPGRGERQVRPHRTALHVDRRGRAARRLPHELPLLRSVRREGRDRAGDRSIRRIRRVRGRGLLSRRARRLPLARRATLRPAERLEPRRVLQPRPVPAPRCARAEGRLDMERDARRRGRPDAGRPGAPDQGGRSRRGGEASGGIRPRGGADPDPDRAVRLVERRADSSTTSSSPRV